jgi:hypothetical protein
MISSWERKANHSNHGAFANLLTALSSGRTIALIGAGVSAHAKYPTWSELLAKRIKGSELTIDTLASLGLTMVAMPRPLRIQYSGARYHVMSRGDGARSEPPMDY